ncbi:protein prkA, partial [SAR202 cluster bacterium AD-804-J14_MRT_500m]|nr:protein prkA [SAR202 cluster bacterium AD-804-J14_MRT_500m]
ITKLFQEIRQESEALAWEGTFREYLKMAIKTPKIVQTSHARVRDMIQSYGVTDKSDGTQEYGLFENEVFGSNHTIVRLMQIFQAAAQIPEERRRILLLMGPPGSGKSTIVNIIKRGLENYTRTDEGAVYSISGCPMQEEPLHLIPRHRRQEFKDAYGFEIEGDLCPRCRHSLSTTYKNDISKVKIKRIAFAESQGIGIGAFVATSPQGQDVARLIGSIDVDSLTEDRLEGAGKGFRLDGELEAANRGIMEFIQFFRSDDKFLTVVLGVAQEQTIKLGSFGSVYADEAIIAHSNEAEYDNFVENKEAEALLDRLIMLRVPYTLQRSQEVKIYQKLLSDNYKSEIHISPITLPLIASLSIISRMEGGKRVAGLPRLSLIDKLEMYDNIIPPPYTKSDVESLQVESPSEGMFGLSPRYVLNRIADSISLAPKCLLPVDALENLVTGLEERAGLSQDQKERFPDLLNDIIKAYRKMAIHQVRLGASNNFEEAAQTQFEYYMNDAKSFVSDISEDTQWPTIDEKLLRRIEGSIAIRDSERIAFRSETVRIWQATQTDKTTPSYKDFPLLRMALENLLLPNLRELTQVLDLKQASPSLIKRREEIAANLTSIYDYCSICADDVIRFAHSAIQNHNVLSVKKGQLVRQ